MTDVDEFLCPQGNDLRTILQRAVVEGITDISVPCFNMTGRILEFSKSATEALTLRIDRPVIETRKQALSGNLPVPYIFIRHPPKTIARASAFTGYRPGMHAVTTAWGNTGEFSELRFLHYPIRGFDKFQTKIDNAAAFFEENTHLKAWWSWHWRSWNRLNQ